MWDRPQISGRPAAELTCEGDGGCTGALAQVQNDSVNCVAFCKEPAQSELFMMVTPFLATSAHGVGDLQASMTTLVEGFPLMPALIWCVHTTAQARPHHRAGH